MTHQRTSRDLARGLVDELRKRPPQPRRGSTRVMAMLATFVALWGLASGCGASLVGTRAWFETAEEARLAKQAAFDLGCPAAQIQLTSLGQSYKTIGAIGCGKRTSYLFVFGTGWSRNSEVLVN